MLERLKRRLSFANVMSAIAVFIALSAGAYAALGPNSVGSRQIKKGAVKPSDLNKRSGLTIQGGSTIASTGANAFDSAPAIGTSDNAAFGAPNAASAPVNMTVSNLRVESIMGVGEAREVAIVGGNPQKVLVKCTVPSSGRFCRSSGSGTLKAGDVYNVSIHNGPGGASNPSVWWGYTISSK